MKVLALMTDAYGGFGGIAQYNRDLLDAVSAIEGIESVVSIPRLQPQSNMVLPVKLIEYPVSRNVVLYIYKCLRMAFRVKPDLILCGHINLLPVAGLLKRLFGVPVWLQLHGIDAWQSPSSLIQRVIEKVGLVTCVSRFTRRKFLSWANIDPAQVKVLPNTISEQYQTRGAGELRKKLGLEEKKIILTVGRLSVMEQYKGHDRIIRALPDLIKNQANIFYLIAGDGDDKQRLEALTEELNLKDNVKFLGKVPNKQLAELYSMADLFAMPSTGEGFGIVFLEAMISGTPALSLDCDGSVDPLQDGLLGIVTNEKNLGNALLAALNEEKTKDAQLANKVESIFGQSKFRKQVRQLFLKCDA